MPETRIFIGKILSRKLQLVITTETKRTMVTRTVTVVHPNSLHTVRSSSKSSWTNRSVVCASGKPRTSEQREETGKENEIVFGNAYRCTPLLSCPWLGSPSVCSISSANRSTSKLILPLLAGLLRDLFAIIKGTCQDLRVRSGCQLFYVCIIPYLQTYLAYVTPRPYSY